jgi:GT2 family glycosyltransferase
LSPPGVSVLICTRDRRAMLDALLSDLVRQEYPQQAMEVLVVEETDTPRPIKGVRYIPIPTRNLGVAHARNVAWSHATNDIVVYVDDDCRVSPKWLKKLLTPFTDLTVVGIQGGVTVPESAGAIGWSESILGFPGGGISKVLKARGKNHETEVISTLNCAYRKWVIDKVGGFDERLKVGSEDFLFAQQVRKFGRCLFVPGALVRHAERGRLISIWRWFVRRGRGEIDVIRTGKLEDTHFWKVLRGSLTLKLLFLVLIGTIVPGRIIFFTLVCLSLYLLLQLARYYGPWRFSRAPILALVLLPIVKLTMDTAMDWGRFRGIVID